MKGAPLNTITPTDMLRYSTRPLEKYARIDRGVPVGPAFSTLLKTDEAWNLAFLSFDYDAKLEHPDANFTRFVFRTVNTVLSNGEVDAANQLPAHLKVRGLLRLPAPQFVALISRHVMLHKLPLHVAYGDDWLVQMHLRAPLCRVAASEAEDEDLTDLSAAGELLAKFRPR